ncbi:hypothetical protein [Janthinobacterium sp. RB2R34]|uniref:hypothetical protein n=1 Tax=Janthinobacterium sp. RB2R34 TaxID=3424193 RepID=UPI003F249301
MSQTLFPAGASIAVLDTNVFRGMGHEEPEWLGAFEEISKHNFVFSISDLAFAEVGYQFTSGQIGLATFNKAIELAERFISVDVPLFPSKTDIMGMIGAKDTIRKFDPAEVSSASKKAWSALKSLSTLSDDQKQQQAVIFQEAIEEDRAHWINFFSKKAGGLDLQSPGYLQRQFDQLDQAECSPPISSTRFDFKTRHFYRKCLHFQKQEEAYDPTHEKKKNDGLDDDLLHYLAVPAYVLTVDKGIIAAANDIESFQSNWIMKPEDFVAAWKAGNLPPLAWPAVAPNRPVPASH